MSIPPDGRGIDFTKDFEQQDMKYDSTGMFHWCPARNLDECVLVSLRLVLQHVVIIVGTEYSRSNNYSENSNNRIFE